LKLASIGPETTKALAKLNLKPAIEAKPHTLEALVRAMLPKPRRRGRA
jgi:uroporphyrinogen-III synthase